MVDYRNILLYSVICSISQWTIVQGTFWYYAMYRGYPTGDNIITTYHGAQAPGSQVPHRKWTVECFDGEAAIGISDNIWDFGALTFVWCKFMFPYKPPSNGIYPYYSSCHVHDFRQKFFCYDTGNHSLTVNTFVTGVFDDDWVFWVFTTQTDLVQPYKCCKTPRGYYIDYVSCYYLPTHDLYWEYYDGNYFLVNCATGYVMTGLAAKINPIHHENRIDWIQCCRVGFGSVIALPPPVIQRPGKPPAYVASHNTVQLEIPKEYQHQYRRKKRSTLTESNTLNIGNQSIYAEEELPEDHIQRLRAKETFREVHNFDHGRYAHLKAPYSGRATDYDLPLSSNFINSEMPFFHPETLD